MNTNAISEPCLTCGNYKNRGLSVDAVIVMDGKVLLGKRGRDPDKGSWALIGGYVEWDESVEEALRREVKEEANLEVTKMHLVNVYSNPDRHPKQTINIAYLVEVTGEPQAGDDIDELKYFKLDELPEMAFDHQTILTCAVSLPALTADLH
jgi:8-oxo-dGTP diphosphatase